MARSLSGQVGLQKITKTSGTYLYLWIPGQFMADKKGARYSLKLVDTPANYAKADIIRRQVQIDLDLGRFRWEDRYQYTATSQDKGYLVDKPLSPQKVWDFYQAAHAGDKASTLAVREAIATHLKSAPTEPNQLAGYLQSVTTPWRKYQIIHLLKTAYRWAIRQGLTKTNPLIHADNKQPTPNAGANPFTPEEKERALEIAKTVHWGLFFEFLLLTGCRPSEAVGLTWGQISKDAILFDRSITRVNNQPVRNKLSKTNRSRFFPLHEKLINLLGSIPHQSDLVFGSGEECLNYLSFYQWWKVAIDPWKPSSPYTCRDSFITDQILKGVPIAVVAKWCDNSVLQIETRYLRVLPSDFKPIF